MIANTTTIQMTIADTTLAGPARAKALTALWVFARSMLDALASDARRAIGGALCPRAAGGVLMLGLLLCGPVAFGAPDRQLREVKIDAGTTIRYSIVAPENLDPKTPAPVLLLLPPGTQDFQMMSAALSLFDDATLKDKPWVIVCPEAPDKTTFFSGAEKHIPALMADIESRVTVEGARYHLVGISNGGVSAFRIAINDPSRVASITTLPGYPHPTDAPKLDKIKSIPVRMHVGSDDSLNWVDSARRTETELKRLGGNVRLNIAMTEGHMIRSLTASAILKELDTLRKVEGTMTPAHTEALATLDRFHAAAAKADLKAYFDLFAPEGVFIGTDATERWTVAEFRAYAEPLFKRGRGWTYKPRAAGRHVELSPAGDIAWFSEILDNEKYGVCRGTGVLRKIDGSWRVAQYHLTVPVPNDLMERVTMLIKAKAPKEPAKKK
jgi:predicted esterase